MGSRSNATRAIPAIVTARISRDSPGAPVSDRDPEVRDGAPADRSGRPAVPMRGGRLQRVTGGHPPRVMLRAGGPPTLPDERCRRHYGGAPSPRVRPLHRDLSKSSLREGTEMSSVSGSAVAVTAGDPDPAAPPAVCPGRRRRSRPRWGPTLTIGLTGAEAAARLARYGPNQITGEKPPSILAVALTQLRDPMNIMLIAVTAVSFAIGQVSTGVIVGLLILLNVVLGSRQELKARASVDALSNLQVPQAKVVRGRRAGAGAGGRGGARRPGPARGRRHRSRGRPDRPVRDAGGAGGGAHR